MIESGCKATSVFVLTVLEVGTEQWIAGVVRCDRKHHTSIYDRLGEQFMPATSATQADG